MGKNRDEFELNGVLNKGCSFEGKLMFDGTVHINGDFKGDILSDGTLVIGAEAVVQAKIQVDTLVIDGNVQGQIEAKKKVELHRGSRLVGNIITPALAIEEGALFQGQCQMMGDMSLQPALTTAPAGHHKVPGAAAYAEEGEDSLMM